MSKKHSITISTDIYNIIKDKQLDIIKRHNKIRSLHDILNELINTGLECLMR